MTDLLEAYLKNKGIELQKEYRFHKVRKWRIDLYFESGEKKIGIEIEGGVWTGGRHTRGAGFTKDMEKYNSAGLQGIIILRFTPQQIKANKEIELISILLGD